MSLTALYACPTFFATPAARSAPLAYCTPDLVALAAATTTGPEYSSVDAFSSSRASTPSTATGARSSTRCTTGVAFSLTTGTTLLTPSAAALPSAPAVSTV